MSVRRVTVCSILLKKIILSPPSDDQELIIWIDVIQCIVIIAVHKYIYKPIDLIWAEEIKFLKPSKLLPPAASLIPSINESRFNKIKPVIKADIRKNIAINVKKIIPDSLNVTANCFEISEPKNAPIDPPAAMTPKTFVAPSPIRYN